MKKSSGWYALLTISSDTFSLQLVKSMDIEAKDLEVNYV